MYKMCIVVLSDNVKLRKGLQTNVSVSQVSRGSKPLLQNPESPVLTDTHCLSHIDTYFST